MLFHYRAGNSLYYLNSCKIKWSTSHVNGASSSTSLLYSQRRSSLALFGVFKKLSNDNALFSTLREGREGDGNSANIKNNSKPWSKAFDALITLMGYYGKESTAIRQGQMLYRSCQERASYPSLLRYLNLPEEFVPQQQVLLLHVWLIHRRLLHEGDLGKLIQEALFDKLWEDTERRLRAVGVHEMSINKQLVEVQKWSFGAMIAYDQGFKNVLDKDMELGSAVFRNVFGGKKSTPDELVYSVAKWLRGQNQQIQAMPFDKVLSGTLPWSFPPGVVVNELENVERGISGEWRRALSVEGKEYWWHTKTRKSQWNKPGNDEETRINSKED